MRILFLTPEYGADVGTGGIGTYVATAAEAMVMLGHEVHVLVCSPDREAVDERVGAVVVHHRATVRIRGLHRFSPGSRTADRVASAVSAFVHWARLDLDFDVIESPEWMAAGLLFGWSRVAPLVTHLHTPLSVIERYNLQPADRDGRWADALERMTARAASEITSPSNLLVNELRSVGWLKPTQRVEIVPLPVDVAGWSSARDVASTEPVVVVVGRVEARKDPLLVARAVIAAGLRVPNVRVAFIGRSSGDVGGTPYAEWVEAEAGDRRCRFVGEVPWDAVRAWYDRARVVVVASRFESFSIAAIEAMASGRPVVVSDRVGAAELIAGSDGGRCVAVGDEAALTEALLPFLSDPAAAAASGRAARAIVERACSPRSVAACRIDVYRRAVAPSPQSSFLRSRRLAVRRLGRSAATVLRVIA